MTKNLFRLVAATTLIACVSGAFAQEIKIGMTGSFTGASASIGIPYRNAAELFPATLGGAPVKWIVLDDASDTTSAVTNARRLVDAEHVDAIIGSTSTPGAVALFDIANESKTAQLAMSPVQIPQAKQAWIFNVPQPVALMVSAVVDDMQKRGIKSAAFIGYSDGWGELNWEAFKALTAKAGIKITNDERYHRTDTSVKAQILKIRATKPEAVFIGASGTPAVMPHITLKDLGFKGSIYHTHGAVSQAFLKTGGKAVEGALMPAGPMVVAEDLPDSDPIKKVALDFIATYQAKWGKDAVQPFAGYAWDGMLLLDAAAKEALKMAKPGTEAFRKALRDALESDKPVVGTNAVYKYGTTDHYGVDERARVLVVVKDGAFRLAK